MSKISSNNKKKTHKKSNTFNTKASEKFNPYIYIAYSKKILGLVKIVRLEIFWNCECLIMREA